ncbi:SDR family NAD(P)-dependent oxidoreductase [Oleidesulfovibrio sp.]|uniref:SDR family NAD(P)-dependent oxidoreductase n=1 Tax=Oleidesulfovibrio sp. TaxID=2909707 RepID=UPI003A856050
MGRLPGKTAIITGSSRGIGKALAIAFAREGATSVVTYQSAREQAESVAAEIRDAGGSCLVTHLDVRSRASVRECFAKVHQVLGSIDILVNNAGINRRGWFEEATDEDWDLIMETNLKGPFICSQEVFPYMKAQKSGRIINMSSVAGQYHGPKTVHYAVSKAGLNSLTKIVARYGAPHNILVNAVAPGLVLTDQTEDEFNSPAGKVVIDMTLLKRPGTMEDIISACLMLAEDAQQYMTGQVISVSGGAYLG